MKDTFEVAAAIRPKFVEAFRVIDAAPYTAKATAIKMARAWLVAEACKLRGVGHKAADAAVDGLFGDRRLSFEGASLRLKNALQNAGFESPMDLIGVKEDALLGAHITHEVLRELEDLMGSLGFGYNLVKGFVSE